MKHLRQKKIHSQKKLSCNWVFYQTIDLDLDLDDVKEDINAAGDAEDIDWGDLVIEESDTAEIDWGVGNDDDLSCQIVLEDSGTSGGVATGNEAFCVLDNKRLRNLVLDELNELAVFCKTRCIELSSASQEKNFVLNDSLISLGDGNVNDWQSAHSEIYELIESLTGNLLIHFEIWSRGAYHMR